MNEQLLEAIKSRRTIRKYKIDKKISREIVEGIIEAGRWAPSAHNMQPWKFIVVEKEEIIKSIYSIMIAKEKELLAGFNIVIKETAKCLIGCPCLIIAYSDNSIAKKFDRLDEPYKSIGRLYEIQSVSFAIANIMLNAHIMGIGSACLGVALFCENEISQLLKQRGALIALLTLGFSDENPSIQKRRPLSEITTFI